jgi:hypothetical protein
MFCVGWGGAVCLHIYIYTYIYIYIYIFIYMFFVSVCGGTSLRIYV